MDILPDPIAGMTVNWAKIQRHGKLKDRESLMTGKAYRVPRVMGCVVHARIIGEADAENHERAEKQQGCCGNEAVRDTRYVLNCAGLRFGGHVHPP
jgi:hypothetical protein